MTKAEEIKHSLYHDYSWTSKQIDELDLHINDVIEATEQAINYTHCCTELKDKEKISFEEWLRVEDIKKHQDGTFYISSERRYVELNFLINRYNSLNL
jgi:hypothetical protein